MAIGSKRLDGENVGIQLSAPSVAVDVFTLNMTSGAVTSGTGTSGPFFTAKDTAFLEGAAQELFSIVPFGDRAAAASVILSKLCQVSAADASSVTLSAVFDGVTSYTLRATVTAAPAALVAHISHSIVGALTWSGSAAGGGGGGGLVWNEEVHVPADPGPDLTYYRGWIQGGTPAPSDVAAGDTVTIDIGGVPLTYTATAGAPVAPTDFQVGATNEDTFDNLLVAITPQCTGAGFTATKLGAAWLTIQWPTPAVAGCPSLALSTTTLASFYLYVDPTPYYVETAEEAGLTPINSGDPTQDYIIATRGSGALVKRPATDPSLIPGKVGKRGSYAVDLGSSSGPADVASGSFATVSGGYQNQAAGGWAAVAGGHGNKATGNNSTNLGGFFNDAIGAESLAFGNLAQADGDDSVALGVHVTARQTVGIQVMGESAPYILTTQQLIRGDRQSSKISLTGDLKNYGDPATAWKSYLNATVVNQPLVDALGQCNVPRIPYRAATANGLVEYFAAFAVRACVVVMDLNKNCAMFELKGLCRSRTGPVYEFIGVPTATMLFNTVGAAAWTAVLKVGYVDPAGLFPPIPSAISVDVDISAGGVDGKAVATMEMTEVVNLANLI